MKINNRIVLISIILIFVFVTSFSIYTFSRYTTKTYGDVSVNTAHMIVNSSIDESLNIDLDDMIPGNVMSYFFNITNYNSEKISEVASKYYIDIDKTNNLPLEIELYKDGNKINLDTDLKSSDYYFGINTNEQHSYELKITWDINDNGYNYANLSDKLTIKVLSEQYIGS